MTAGVFNATNLIVLIDGVAVGHTTSAELSIEADLPDATTKDSAGWAEHIQGLRSWSVSVDGLVAYDGSYPSQTVADLIINRTSVVLQFTTEVTGDTYWTGSASLQGQTISAEMESPASFSASFTGNGALTTATN
jgi:predicted secreted protein